MNITPYKDKLRKLFPTAIITISMDEKCIDWDLKIRPVLTEKEHEEAFPKIQEIFGDTLIERYTETTGYHFHIYQRYSSPSQSN